MHPEFEYICWSPATVLFSVPEPARQQSAPREICGMPPSVSVRAYNEEFVASAGAVLGTKSLTWRVVCKTNVMIIRFSNLRMSQSSG